MEVIMFNSKRFALFALILCALLSNNARAMEGGSRTPQDPLMSLNYRDAFNQEKIYEKYKNYLQAAGCGENIFEDQDPANDVAIDVEEHKSLLEHKTPPTAHPKLDLKTQQAFQEACLGQLKSARRWAITEPARESLTLLGLLVIVAILVTEILGPNSFGGSIGIMAVLFNGVFLLRDTTRSCYNLAFPPAHPLNVLEERFAKEKCFIPKALWSIITEKFMMARQNPFEQRQCTDFINFALGITRYKPRPALQLTKAIDQITDHVSDKAQNFFNDYENANQCFWCVKLNVSKFIYALLNKQSDTPSYIYLFGPGGIGKTRFVRELCQWIEECIPSSVCFEDVVITDAEELEGNADRPGAFLRVLRNQFIANKKSSVVFMDEATWLNDADMVSPSKRVFNGNQATLSTAYFGAGIDGTGVSLSVPPMLIFVASNADIADAALRSRFDMIHYPMPKKEALKRRAFEIAQKSKSLERAGIKPTQEAVNQWIETNNIDNFRFIEKNIERYFLAAQENKDFDAKNSNASGSITFHEQ